MALLLQTYVKILPQRVAFHLYTYMLDVVPSGGERPQVVNYYNFFVALSHMLKGTVSERSKLVGYLVGGSPGDVSTTQLIRVRTYSLPVTISVWPRNTLSRLG